MTEQLVTDIDTLPHRVRDPNSKRLIDDALAAYRGGALRSAIVSTWIAVLYDITSKARELARLGDPALQQYVKYLDNAIENKDHNKMANIERDILDDAEEKFQIITPHEREELQRIKEDRNKCAHLSVFSEEQFYQPTPDQVRTHIVHALQYLLVHGPLQGKSALGKLFEDVKSEVFPSTEAEVREFFLSKYLNRSKDVLVENIVKMILKVFVLAIDDELFEHRQKLSWILDEIHQKRNDIFIKTSKPFFERLYGIKEEKEILSICLLLETNNQIWTWMQSSVRISFLGLIKNCTARDIIEHYVPNAYSVKEIKTKTEEKIKKLDYRKQMQIITSYPYQHFVPLGIKIFSNSENYKMAIDTGFNIILPLSDHFSYDDVISVIEATMNNDQIHGASVVIKVLTDLFDRTEKHLPNTRDKWIELADDPRTSSQYSGFRDKIVIAEDDW